MSSEPSLSSESSMPSQPSMLSQSRHDNGVSHDITRDVSVPETSPNETSPNETFSSEDSPVEASLRVSGAVASRMSTHGAQAVGGASASSGEIAVAVRGLSKSYSIAHQAASTHVATSSGVAAGGGWRGIANLFRRNEKETFWALRDVNFNIARGEIVGIIGRNGAGKSTLLKILSQITEPTAGAIDVYGRIGSLLEVGTGFHPELTGRENIFLNGAILGMRRREIERQFDAIVDFAEVEKFLDTPVKRYSSGMYVRLAFAVAAHFDPEIMVVDEVLAVGDANFQRKCLGKMEAVGRAGRTVLFVSHSMPTILRLCNRVIMLEGGRVVADGSPNEVTRRYLSSGSGRPSERIWEAASAPGDEVARLHAVRVLDEQGQVSETIDITRPLTIEVEYWNRQTARRPTVSIHLVNEEGVTMFVSNDFNNREWAVAPRVPGLVRARCRIPGNLLAEGLVFVLAALVTYNPDALHALERDAVSFQVVDRIDGTSVRGDFGGIWPGVVRPSLDWDIAVTQQGASEVASPSVARLSSPEVAPTDSEPQSRLM